MKRITSIVVNSLLVILICSGPSALTAHAQYDPGIIVDIPFPFSADGQELAAGTYQLHLISSQFLMSVRNVNTNDEQLITVQPGMDRVSKSQGRLIFRVCGEHKYLAEIHIPGSTLFSETLKGRGQKHGDADTCLTEESATEALQ